MEEWASASSYDSFELEKVYDYGLDLIAQTALSDTSSPPYSHTSYYLYDGHGSVRALTDETGAITDSYTYDAFGIQLSQQVLNPSTGEFESVSTGNQSLITDNAYLYAGEYLDADLSLYYLRTRHMNPETGRFHTMDSYEGGIGEPLSLHKYMYAHANPVMGSDPSGYLTLIELVLTEKQHEVLQSIRASGSLKVKNTIIKKVGCELLYPPGLK